MGKQAWNGPVRFAAGCALIVIAVVGLIAARVWVEQPAPARQSYAFGDASLTFSTDRTTVWQQGDCVTLRWESERIREIHIDQVPTVGVREMPWCVDRPTSAPVFSITLQDDSVQHLIPFEFSPAQMRFVLIAMPLLILAAWCFRLHEGLGTAFSRLPSQLVAPFTVGNRVQPILVALFVAINAIVAWNAVTIRAWAGYDVEGHYANVMALAQGRLPTRDDSAEFFSPPLPYVLPALISAVTGLTETPIQKVGQLQNIVVSLITTVMLLRLSARLYPDRAAPRAIALFLLAMLPVYYKSFAFMRGEPLVVMLALILCDRLLTLTTDSARWRDAIVIGVCGGLLMLARQWGALVLLGTALWWAMLWLRQRPTALTLLASGAVAGVITALIGGWFYLALTVQTGTPLAFNREADPSPKPVTFSTGLGGTNLFTYPFTPGFDGQALPVFYTEIWGDYFGYFYLPRPLQPASFPADAVRFMGVVNALSLLPTAVFIAVFAWGGLLTVQFLRNPADARSRAISLFFLIVSASLAGFVWFLARYPSGDADTAKATYVLHVFPFLALMAGDLLGRLLQRHRRIATGILIALALVAAHNLPMLLTRLT